MKLIKLFGILLLTLFAMTGTALAADYAVTSLEVNGESPSGSLHVEPASKVVVHFNVKGLSAEAKDVQARAWLGGYEYGELRSVSKMFKVQQGVTYSKYLVLELPNDLNTGSNDYTLYVELFDANDVVEKTFSLFVEEPRHNLQIQDVVVAPISSVEAGKVLYAKVRVENMGYKMEEDIRVDVAIPELGVSARTYIDELDSRNEDENSQSSSTLYLTIPEDAKSGSYEMNVKLTYDRGYTTTQETKLVYVDGVFAKKAESNSLVSVEVGAKELTVGEESTYQVLVANMGKETSLYTVEVVGAAGWADVKVSPGAVSVSENSTGELVVKVAPKVEGEHQFSVRVKEGDAAVVMEKNISVSVAKAKLSVSPIWIVAGAVLVVIVVLVILSQLQGDKVSKDDFEAYEPANI